MGQTLRFRWVGNWKYTTMTENDNMMRNRL